MFSGFARRKLVKDISASGVQTMATQVTGLIIFYFTSRYLTKEEFGELNWSSALAATVIAISSLGLDLVYVKRMARSENVMVVSGIHFFHTLLAGTVISLGALFLHLFWEEFSAGHPVFYIITIQLCLVNVSNSFRLGLNGLEAYRKLAFLSLFSGLIKTTLVILVFVFGQFNVVQVVIAFILSSCAEFLIGYYLIQKALSEKMKPVIDFADHRLFILESLPQLGVVVFDSALARIDWILLGILATSTITAEYSFAYKVFELSKLPLLVIAPVLLTRLAKAFAGEGPDKTRLRFIKGLFAIEMIALTFIPLCIYILWPWTLSALTDGKYGSDNMSLFALLAVCVPLSGATNMLWTCLFAKGLLRSIFYITLISSFVNVLLNILLIPSMQASGAALAFIGSSFLQFLLYFIIAKDLRHITIYSLLIQIPVAGISLLSFHLLPSGLWQAIVALLVYLVLSALFNLRELKYLKTLRT